MEKNDLITYFASDPDRYQWTIGEHGGQDGIFVSNNDVDTTTHISLPSIEENDLMTLVRATHHGKNVENITRVTGFFSKTKGWNKGKTGELKERQRNCID